VDKNVLRHYLSSPEAPEDFQRRIAALHSRASLDGFPDEEPAKASIPARNNLSEADKIAAGAKNKVLQSVPDLEGRRQ
jgi:hypothetical protein